MSQLHDSLKFFISQDEYHLVADAEKGETLTINRQSNKITITPSSARPTNFEREQTVYGLFGIVSLLKSDYVVLITKRSKAAKILGTTIYAATDFAVFPIERSSSTALLAQPDEAYLLGLVKAHLYSAPFYFTYGGYNVTTRLQAQQKGDDKPFWQQCDDRFFWNRHLQSRLIDLPGGEFSRFILPVMFGFLNIKSATINGRDFIFGLISRRNRKRAGTRYFSRGIDLEGNVSNFNETEQLLLLDPPTSSPPVHGEIQFSYVQTRGSVPVYWAEINNLRYKPDLRIMDLDATAESVDKHFEQQVSVYGDQYLINLVNQKGYEKPVKEAFERAVEVMGNSKVHYTYFDFHHECKGLRYDRVQSVLLDGLDLELHQQGYFFQDTTAKADKPKKVQTSVVRTNCMDCLDRTNVVQSALGKWVLNNQLREIGVLTQAESIDEHADFLSLFRNIWADNADVVSKAYSGTGALKTDYTRTGKRSKEGALQDGINSVIRYIKNNFLDGPRQDSYDLVTGAWQPKKGESLWKDDRDLNTRAAPYALAFALALILLIALVPTLIANLVPTRTANLASILLVIVSLQFITANGIQYVSWPRLKKLDEVIHYSGKGYESGRKGRPAPKIKFDTASSHKRD